MLTVPSLHIFNRTFDTLYQFGCLFQNLPAFRVPESDGFLPLALNLYRSMLRFETRLIGKPLLHIPRFLFGVISSRYQIGKRQRLGFGLLLALDPNANSAHLSPPLYGRHSRAYMRARFSRLPLSGQTAPVDPCGFSGCIKCGIGKPLPLRSDQIHRLGIREAHNHLAGLEILVT
ncbi:hypothetical protein ABDK74_15810 [Gluconobacter sp. OJB]